MTSEGRVAGKAAFITGAARGQGRAHAVRLAQEGASIVAVDTVDHARSVGYPLPTEADLDETRELVERAGGRIVTALADVRDRAALAAAVEQGLDRFGSLDIVSANAGIVSFAPALEMDDEQWSEMIDVNLTGVWNTVRAAVPPMVDAGRGGAVILTSSVVAFSGARNVVHYNAAKSGVLGIMRSLASELGPHGIRVNAIAPGNIGTPMLLNDETLRIWAPDKAEPTYDDLRERSRQRNALGLDWAEDVDISNALLWLASDEARYVTGVTIPVDAGMLVT